MDPLLERSPDQFHSTFSNNGDAWLFFYAPRMYGTQVLRPYSYQINGNAVDKLVHGGSTMTEALGKKQIATDPDVASAIQPTANGTPLDMDQVGNCWTFVLQIDLVSPWLGGSSMGGAKARRRIVYTGVCLDEPLSMVTMWNGEPTINENCPLRFTHAMETVVDPSVGGMGAQARVMVRSDIDIVDAALNAQANDTDLYVATPDKLLGNCDVGSGINTEGLAALANQRKGVGIVSTLKSPLAHLRQLCMGLDQQVHLCESSVGNTIGNHMIGATDVFDVDSFKSGVVGEWSQLSTGLNDTSGNIAAGDIILLGFITKTYPSIKIIPQNITKFSPLAEQNGVCDQMKINPKSVYSSMVAASVSTLANNFGFSMIDFSYDSYCNQFDSNKQGSFEVRDAYLLMPPSDPMAAKEMLAKALEFFRQQLLLDLVPSLKASNNGDFQMHVMYMLNAETYVDLNFYDWASLSNEGIYETTNRIANVGSTSVATAQQFISNGATLDSLVHNVYGRNMRNQFGAPAFGSDPGDILNAAARESPGFGY